MSEHHTHPDPAVRTLIAKAQAEALRAVKTLHDTWGDTNTEDLDPLDMWESLGRILDGNPS